MMVMYENSSDVLHAHLPENSWCVPKNVCLDSTQFTRWRKKKAPTTSCRNHWIPNVTHNRRQLHCNFVLFAKLLDFSLKCLFLFAKWCPFLSPESHRYGSLFSHLILCRFNDAKLFILFVAWPRRKPNAAKVELNGRSWATKDNES